MKSTLLKIATLASFGILTSVTEATQPTDSNWPSFRGTGAEGIATGPTPPTTWDVERGTNIRWRQAVPGLAHSSPIVWGDVIYISTAVKADGEARLSSLYGSEGYGAGESVIDEGVHVFRLYCIDKHTGEIRWQRDAATGVPKVKRHPKSSHANPTPACDASRVVVFFASEGLFCFDHDGNEQWSRDFGILNSGAPGYPDKDGYQWGFASSPVLHDDKVLIQCDVENQSFVAALDAATGADLWRTDRDEDSTWGTPGVYATPDGDVRVVVNGYKHMGAYDIETGEEVWSMSGGGDVPVPTPIVRDGLIYLTNAHGRMRPICAVKTTAVGTLSLNAAESEHVAWCHPRQGIYMQTPIIVGGRLYCCSDGGILACYDAATGERLYRERLGAGMSGFSGSAVAVNGTIYFSGESGQIHVIRDGPEFDRLATNEMGETCMATPAVSDGVMYVRTRHHLVAIGAPPTAETPGE